MTPEEGYELARKQRPGAKIVMRPTEAREERMEPVNIMTRLKWYLDLPGDSSWWAYEVRNVCGGKLPHGIALGTGAFVEMLLKRPLTRAELEHPNDGASDDRKVFDKKAMEEAYERTAKDDHGDVRL